MKVPLNWLKDYLDLANQSPQKIAEDFTSLGLMLDKPIENNVLDLEHRMDRSDWLSILGCARDLAAYQQKQLKLPQLDSTPCQPSTPETLVKIKVETPAVRRFNTLVFKNIQVKASPQWLKDRLEAYGIPSINNIVDITNFVMVEYGQPMHAQDLAKFDRREIVIRQARAGETITTLLGETIKLTPEAFVLTQNDQPIVIGGIVGGKHTGVTSTTTEIILDAGNYDQKVVRRVSRQLHIQNETVSRYDKFLHPRLTEVALARAKQLILDLAGGECYQNIDYYPHPAKPQLQTLRYHRLQQMSGLTLKPKLIKSILQSLGYRLVKEASTQLTLEIPYYRTDIQVEDDLVADVLRIYGYHQIPLSSLTNQPPQEITSPFYKFRQQLQQILVNLGLHQHITESLVPKSDRPQEVHLANSLTQDKSALRQTIFETLKTVYQTYQKQGYSAINLFEIGLTFRQLNPKPTSIDDFQETYTLGVISSDQHQLRAYLARILQELGIDYYLQPNSKTNTQIDILHQDQLLGWLTSQAFELNLHLLFQLHQPTNPIISSIQNFPKEDLSLILPEKLHFGPILHQLQLQLTSPVNFQVKEEYQDKQLQQAHQKSILLQVTYLEPTKQKTTRQQILDLLATHQIHLKA